MPSSPTNTFAHGFEIVPRQMESQTTDSTTDFATPPPTVNSPKQDYAIAIAASASAVFATIVAAAALILYIKRRRKRTESSDNETGVLGKLGELARWRSSSNLNRGTYSDQLQSSNRAQSNSDLRGHLAGSTTSGPSALLQSQTGGNSLVPMSENAGGNGGAMDRRASVRSIMTLPSYSLAARPTEEIIGREGERAGIDMVLEMPEGQSEEEAQREEEMVSLYQIRQARRAEAAEQADRRRQRQEASARGDTAALARLQQESRDRAAARAAGTTLSAQLIAEHQAKNRDKRISAVQYHEIGTARHDGSRIRNASFDSDNRPLLSGAASIANSSRPSSQTLDSHHRCLSATSLVSAPRLLPGTSAQEGDFEDISLMPTPSRTSTNTSNLSIISTHSPTDLPPHYDHLTLDSAPPYESPIIAQAPELHLPCQARPHSSNEPELEPQSQPQPSIIASSNLPPARLETLTIPSIEFSTSYSPLRSPSQPSPSSNER